MVSGKSARSPAHHCGYDAADNDSEYEPAFLDFPDMSDLTKFLEAAVPFDDTPGSLCDKVTGGSFFTGEEGEWHYTAGPLHVRFLDGEDHSSAYLVSCRVWFPPEDIAELTANLVRRVETIEESWATAAIARIKGVAV